MSKHKLPSRVVAALDETKLMWSTKDGGKHIKVILAGRFVGVTNRNGEEAGRGVLNLISQIRKAAKEMAT